MNNIGELNKRYISAVDPMLDKREIDGATADIWRETDFSDILSVGERKVPMTNSASIYFSWVKDQLIKPTKLTAATGSDTNTVTLTTDAASTNYARVGDIYTFLNGGTGIVQSVVYNAAGDTIVVKSPSSTKNITVGSTDTIYVTTFATGENSTAPTPRRYGVSKLSGKMQVFRDSAKVTDIQDASPIEANVGGSNRVVYMAHLDALDVLKGNINRAFINGEMSESTFSDDAPWLTDPNVTDEAGGNAVQTTGGLNYYLNAYGRITTQTTTGVIAKGDIDKICDALDAARSDNEQLIMSNRPVKRQFDTYFKNQNSSGVTSARLNVDGREIDFTVDKFTYGGYTFNFSNMRALDHDSFKGTKVGKRAFIVPLNGRAKLKDGGDAPLMRTRYINPKAPFGNDLIGETHSGALAPGTPTGHEMHFLASWVSYQGFECLAPQKIIGFDTI